MERNFIVRGESDDGAVTYYWKLGPDDLHATLTTDRSMATLCSVTEAQTFKADMENGGWKNVTIIDNTKTK